MHRITRTAQGWRNSLPCFRGLSTRARLTGQSRWDVAGHHPNITPVSRTPYKALEYVSKDCDITHDCFDESNRPRRDSGRPKGNGKRKWSEIISAPDENSFLESLKENDPRALVVCHGNSDNTLGGDTPLNDDIMNRLPGSPSESTSTKESKRSLHESDSEVGISLHNGAAPLHPLPCGGNPCPLHPFAAHSHTRILCGWPLARRGPAFRPPTGVP